MILGFESNQMKIKTYVKIENNYIISRSFQLLGALVSIVKHVKLRCLTHFANLGHILYCS